MRPRPWIPAIVCLAGGWLGAPAAVTARVPAPWLLGFQSDGDPTRLIAHDAPRLGAVGVDGLNLTGRPGAVSPVAGADRAQLAAAHRAGRPATLLVGNFSAAIDDFSEPLARRTLRSPRARARLVRTLRDDVVRDGWNGVTLDLESLRAADGPGLVELVRALSVALGPSRPVLVCVASFTDARAYSANGYRLHALGAAASGIVLMAYDEHGPWEATPGPVGAVRWVRSGLRALLRAVPAREVDLGVAGYGYEWDGRTRRQLSDPAAWALVRRDGARARWVGSVGEWTARLPHGGVVWWSDARTLRERARLAEVDRLHGLALWSLGLAGALRAQPARAATISASILRTRSA